MPQEDSLFYVQRAKEGDREAWEILYKRYFPLWIERLRGKIGVDLHLLYDTEDILQSALADAIRDIHSLRSETSFWVWVAAIAQRKIFQKSRKHRQQALALADSELNNLAHTDGDPVKAAEQEEMILKLYDALIELFPLYPQQMTAVYLHYFQGKKISEVASTLNLSQRSAERFLSAGKKLLASKFRSV